MTLKTTNDSTRSRKHCLLALLRRHIPPHQDLLKHPAIPSHAELDMHKVIDAAGGTNYETVLCETDIHMGPDSENPI